MRFIRPQIARMKRHVCGRVLHTMRVTGFISNLVPLRSPSSRQPQQTTTPRCALSRRALGVDYGLSRVGLAVSIGIAPRLLPIYRERDATLVAKHVATTAHEYMAQDIIVGLPLNSSGERGEQAKLTIEFANLLTATTPHHHIYLLDERFTTTQANEILRNNSNAATLRDSLAAANILERYFAKCGEVRPELFHEPVTSVFAETSVSRDNNEMVSFEEWKKMKMREAKQLAETLAKEKKRRRRK